MREWIRRDPELVARRYATLIDLTEADDTTNARLESALGEARPVPSPTDLRERLDGVLAGSVEGSVTGIAPLLSATAGFLRALAAGSNRVDRGRHRRARRPRHPPRLRPPGHRR